MAEGNLLLGTDSYKVTHHLQYPPGGHLLHLPLPLLHLHQATCPLPNLHFTILTSSTSSTSSSIPSSSPTWPGTEKVFSYFEAREGGKWGEALFFGLQMILKKHLAGVVVTEAKIEEAREVLAEHFGTTEYFNEAGWRHILARHGGRLPLVVRAVPEGTLVPTGNVLFTVENTDPAVPWLTNYVETVLVRAWYPTTVATNSHMMKRLLRGSLERTAESVAGLPTMLHDFGARGCTGAEAAGLGGAAHLVNFRGTDTLEALVVARRYYGAAMAGHSIAATEHSTMTTWGRGGEGAAVRHLLAGVGDEAAVSVVADSYDLWAMLEEVVGGELREEVAARGGVLVVRPDSGEPAEVVPRVLEVLGRRFGSTTNSRGFRVLPPCVRVIQGDGVTHDALPALLAAVEAAGWSTENLAFGSGGGLLQKLNRDTLRCAFKCSLVTRGGEEVEVYKAPLTDPTKASKAGRLALVRGEQGLRTKKVEDMVEGEEDLLVEVFR